MSDRLENILPAEWTDYLHHFHQKELEAESIILSEGNIARKVYFIEKGCVRLAYNDHGKDISFHFFFEGDVFTSQESFWLNQPCLFSMETIEPVIMHVLEKNDLDKILKESSIIKTQLELHKMEMLVFYQKQLLIG